MYSGPHLKDTKSQQGNTFDRRDCLKAENIFSNRRQGRIAGGKEVKDDRPYMVAVMLRQDTDYGGG